MTAVDLSYATLIFLRTCSFAVLLPPVAGRSIPVPVKVGIAAGLSLCFWNRVPMTPGIEASLLNGPWFTMCALFEVFLGLGLAWLAGSLVSIAGTVGGMIADEIGLNVSGVTSFVDTGASTSVSQLLEALMSMLLFALNFHHVFILMLLYSFFWFPAGQLASAGSAVAVIDWYALLGTAPIAMALPLTAISLAGLVLISVIMKQAPQFNLLSFGMPLRLMLGMFALFLFLPTLLTRFAAFAQHFEHNLVLP